MRGSLFDKSWVVFYLYCLLLILTPVPFGLVPDWSWSWLGILWLLLFCIVIVISEPMLLKRHFRTSYSLHIIMILWLVWIAVQLVPLPSGLIQFISPNAFDAWLSMQNIVGMYDEKLVDNKWYTLSLDPLSTKYSLYKSVVMYSIIVSTLLLVRSKRKIVIVAWVLVISGLIQSLYGMYMVMSGIEKVLLYDKQAGRGLVTGTFINRNHMAGYLVICLSMAFGLMLGAMRDKPAGKIKNHVVHLLQAAMSKKIILRIMLIVIVIGLVMTRSRMGNISFGLSLTLIGILAWYVMTNARRSIGILVISIFIIDILIISAWFGLDRLATRFTVQPVMVSDLSDVTDQAPRGLVSDVTGMMGERTEVNKTLVSYLGDYWLTGSGLGSFEAVYTIYRSSNIAWTYQYAHNDYLQFSVEVGLIGIALLSMLLAFIIRAAYIGIRHSDDSLLLGIALGCAMSIVAMLLHALVDFNLQIPAYAYTFMVVIALLHRIEVIANSKS